MDINESAASVRGQRISAAAVDYLIYQFITLLAGLVMIPFIGLDTLMEATLGFLEGEAPSDAFILYSVFTTIIGLVIGIIYYGWVPAKKNGQTLGKTFFHVRAVDENGEDLPFSRHLARAIMLYGLYVGTPTLLFLTIDYSTYTSVNSFFSIIVFGLVILSLVFILTRPDAKGVHDMIAKSHVVDEHYKMDEKMQKEKTEEDPLAFDYDAWEDKDDPWS